MKLSDSKQSLDIFDKAQGRKRTRVFNPSELDQKESSSQATGIDGLGKSNKKKNKDEVKFTAPQNVPAFIQNPYISPQPTGYGGPAFNQQNNQRMGGQMNYAYNDQGNQLDFQSTGNFWKDCPLWCKAKCAYFGCNCFQKRGVKSGAGKADKENMNMEVYSSGESDSEFVTVFGVLTTDEKVQRNCYLWKRAYDKAKGAALLLAKFQDLKEKIACYGSLSDSKRQIDDEVITINDIDKATCIINPNAKWKQRWNFIIAGWLVYVAIVIPLRVSFSDETTLPWIIFDCVVDVFFITDIFLTFFTAIERNNDQLEVRHKEIAKNYFKLWFWIDSLSSIPVQLLELESFKVILERNTSSTKLLRLARLPRLYRIIRILRLVKMMRFAKKNKSLRKLTEFMSLTSGVTQMLGVVVTVVFLTHVSACFWFLQAKLENFEPETWPVRKGLVDEGMSIQYSVAVYWAFQTLTTVGFGDVSGVTVAERIFAIVWMLLGVAMYSYAIGNMTNMIASMDFSNEELQKNLGILKELRIRTKMPTLLFQKIKRHLEKNQESNTNFAEQEKLLVDLPQTLRSQIISCTHGEIIEKLEFFKDKEHEFLITVMPELKPLKLNIGDILYQQKDHAEEIYMIKSGKIKLNIDINDFLSEDNQSIFRTDAPEEGIHVTEARNMPFVAYCEGSYFGDSDIFVKSNHLERDSTAIACQECHLFVLSREFIFQLKKTHEQEISEMQELAKKRRAKHVFLIKQLARKISAIQKEKEETGNTDAVDYELNLMMMDDFQIDSSEYDSLESDKDINDSGFQKGMSFVQRMQTVREAKTNKKTRDSHDNSSSGLRKSHKHGPLSKLEKSHKELNDRHHMYLENHKETIENFKENVNMLSIQSEYLTSLMEEINQGQVQQNINASLKRLGTMVDQIKQNNEVSVACLNQVIQHASK